jgi:hypothetical protein
VIGLDEANCIAAIRSLGIDPALQAEGFRRGIRFGRRAGGRVRRAKTPYQFTRRRRALVDHRSRRTFEQLVERVDTFLPPQHVTVAQEAIFMLCEFQDAEWATRLVDELEAVARAEQQLLGSAAIAGEDSIVGDVVRGLATLLVWPDPAWIAQRKLHPARLKALRAANSLTRHDQYELIDSLVLDESERRSLRSPRMRMGSEPVRPSILQDIRVERIVTTSPRGAAQLRRMAAAKKHRRIDARTSRELDTLQSWLEALHDALRIDHELARIVARSALIVQGQGAVRDAHRVSAEAFWGRVVRQSIAIDRAAAGSIPTVSARVIPFVWEQMCTSGALALWEFAAPMLAITMSHARGMPLAQTLEHIEQMCTAQAARVS